VERRDVGGHTARERLVGKDKAPGAHWSTGERSLRPHTTLHHHHCALHNDHALRSLLSWQSASNIEPRVTKDALKWPQCVVHSSSQHKVHAMIHHRSSRERDQRAHRSQTNLSNHTHNLSLSQALVLTLHTQVNLLHHRLKKTHKAHGNVRLLALSHTLPFTHVSRTIRP
jgi:hypothetical protein